MLVLQTSVDENEPGLMLNLRIVWRNAFVYLHPRPKFIVNNIIVQNSCNLQTAGWDMLS